MNHSLLSNFVLASLLLVTDLFGQVVLFRDDFESGLASDWKTDWGHLGIREVVDGNYQLKPDGLDQSLMKPYIDGMPDDLTIRSRFRMIDEPEGGWIAMAIGARDVPDGDGLWAVVATDGRYGIGSDEKGVITTASHTFALVDEEVEVQFDIFGDQLLFTAWLVGSPKPEPQFTVTDTNATGDRVALHYNPLSTLNQPVAAFGYVEVVGHSLCNLNRKLACDISDLDALVGSGDLIDGFEVSIGKIVRYDLDQNGVVNTNDLDKWLTDAATENGLAGTYLKGDSNLDGMVDSTDLNAVALSWKQDGKTWSQGDFDGDGKVGSSDLNQLALNWNQSVAAAAPVPEPFSRAMFILAVTALFSFVRKK